jgi:hypothetical protein
MCNELPFLVHLTTKCETQTTSFKYVYPDKEIQSFRVISVLIQTDIYQIKFLFQYVKVGEMF